MYTIYFAAKLQILAKQMSRTKKHRQDLRQQTGGCYHSIKWLCIQERKVISKTKHSTYPFISLQDRDKTGFCNILLIQIMDVIKENNKVVFVP
jgi:hypothetical protein